MYNCEKLDKKLDEIKEWNAETFPDTTLSGQLCKLEEEMLEYKSSPSKEELADVFIVLGGLRRFNSAVGDWIFIDFIYRYSPGYSYKWLIDAIDNKMKINRARKWHKTDNGTYHH